MGICDYKLRPSSSPPTCLDVSVKKTKIKNQKQIQNSLSLSLSLKVLYIYIYIYMYNQQSKLPTIGSFAFKVQALC